MTALIDFIGSVWPSHNPVFNPLAWIAFFVVVEAIKTYKPHTVQH